MAITDTDLAGRRLRNRYAAVVWSLSRVRQCCQGAVGWRLRFVHALRFATCVDATWDEALHQRDKGFSMQRRLAPCNTAVARFTT